LKVSPIRPAITVVISSPCILAALVASLIRSSAAHLCAKLFHNL
jgi:hypothetical protein